MKEVGKLNPGVLLAGLGAVLLISSALTGGQTIVGTTHIALDSNYRTALLVFGGLLVVSGILAVYWAARSAQATQTSKTCQQQQATFPRPPEDIFYNWDDRRCQTFGDIIKNSTELILVGRTVVNVLNSYSKELKQVLESNGHVTIVTVDEGSPGALAMYHNSPELFSKNSSVASSVIDELKKLGKDRLIVLKCNCPPNFAILFSKGSGSRSSTLLVQLYFVHAAIGRDRPLFIVPESDKWYPMFKKELDAIVASSNQDNNQPTHSHV